MFGNSGNVRGSDAHSDSGAVAGSDSLANSTDVIYSFDASTSPSDRVGLDALVEGAERLWREKEVERVVREEWECLDAKGEVLGGRKVGALGRKKAGGARPEGQGGATKLSGKKVGGAGVEEVQVDDDDYELV